MRIYFARHGESEANLLHVFSNRGVKHGLTARGREQAEALAARLAGVAFAATYASPLLRATETADILRARLGVPYTTTPALIEYDVGQWEDDSSAEGWAEHDRVLSAWMREGNPDARVGGGESYREIEARFVPFIEALRAAHGTGDRAVLLVAHGGLYRCMLPLVLRNISATFALEHTLGNAAYALAELHGPDLVCLRWNDEDLAPEG
jgi:2,3-bisphosphoglycerate-dependent phosphoglycerate mutase